MSKNKPTKTCLSCDLEKPLTAFLEITGPSGTSYGAICATCRGSGAMKTVTLPSAEEEEGDSASGLGINAKKRLQAEIDRLNLEKETKLKEHEDKETKEVKKEILRVRKEELFKSEKQHREGFLNYRSKNPLGKSATDNSGSPNEQAKLDQYINEETIKTKDNVNAPFMDQHTTQINRDNPFFRAWEDLIGESVVTKTVRRQFLGKKTGTANEKKTLNDKNPALDFVEKNWGPKTRK